MHPSSCVPLTAKVSGYDFNDGIDFDRLLSSYLHTGFQATHFGNAVHTVNRMMDWTLNDEPCAEDEDVEYSTADARQKVRCKVFLAYTSNIISAGTRDILRYLAEHTMIQVIVTSAGGIEEDLIKCMADMFIGDFRLPGEHLRRKGINRTGNLLVPNQNYCYFEEWIFPILDAMYEEQCTQNTRWTPSKMINRLGKEINNTKSVYYWCYKNNIPVFCPAITDGSIGDMLYAHSFRKPGLVIDIVEDIRRINEEAVRARKTGVLILGGGLIKHHVLNANLMRNGADFAVYINTAHEFDGSDAGASPDEAISWGKIRIDVTPVKICGDVTLIFPLLVARTFARRHQDGLRVGNSLGDAIFDKGYTTSEHEKERQKVELTYKESPLDALHIFS
jgi:deoxyhypusine synthase